MPKIPKGTSEKKSHLDPDCTRSELGPSSYAKAAERYVKMGTLTSVLVGGPYHHQRYFLTSLKEVRL